MTREQAQTHMIAVGVYLSFRCGGVVLSDAAIEWAKSIMPPNSDQEGQTEEALLILFPPHGG